MHSYSTLRRQAACKAWEPSALSAGHPPYHACTSFPATPPRFAPGHPPTPRGLSGQRAWKALLIAAVAACLAGPDSTAAAEGDPPTVSIDYMGSATGVAYEHESIVFALTRTGDAEEALEVQVEVEETGDMVEAVGEGVQTVTFAAGDGMATFEPAISDDTEDEAHSSVSVSVAVGADAGYLAGSQDTATVEVRDDDGMLVELSLGPLDPAVNEGENASFELFGTAVDDGTFATTSELARVLGEEPLYFEWVTIQVGEAEVGTDFRAFVENFYIHPEDFESVDNRLVIRKALREIPIVDDGVVEEDERFIARLALAPRPGNPVGFAGREPVEGISFPLSGPRFVAAVVTVRGNSGDLRLVGGEVGHEGRLEIYHDGQWGTVCDDYWTDNDSEIACRQLGYPGTESNTGRFLGAHFGQGSGPIWLDNVGCRGHESRLIDCPRHSEGQDIGSHNCTHEEDVGIRCLLVAPECNARSGATTRSGSGNPDDCSE